MQHESALANKLLHSLPRLFHFQKLLLQQPAVNYVEFRLCTRQRNARPKAAGNKQPAREGGPPAIRIGREAVQRTSWLLIAGRLRPGDRKSTRLNSSHVAISYAVFCLKKKKKNK